MTNSDDIAKVQEHGDHSQITLNCDLTVSFAQRIHRVFEDAASRCASVAIDLEHVGETDVAGVQLLLALHSTMKGQDKALRFTKVSEMVMDTMSLLGLKSILEETVAR